MSVYKNLIDLKKHYNLKWSHGYRRIVDTDFIKEVMKKYGPDIETYEGLTSEDFHDYEKETYKSVSEVNFVVSGPERDDENTGPLVEVGQPNIVIIEEPVEYDDCEIETDANKEEEE